MNIPGTSLHHQELVGQAQNRVAGDVGEQAKEAQTAATQAHTGLEQAQTEKLGEPAIEKPEDLQHELADATADALKRGIDPNADPKVKQISDVITSLQKQTTPPEQALEKQYNDAIAVGDHEKAERLLKIMADVAKAKQAPQRAPVTNVILPGGQVETAKPGMTLPAGTQNMGGFAELNRPTTQERNIAGQANQAAQGIPPTLAEIDKLAPQLGPIMGRWNDFMQGKVGMDNPEFAGLRADLLMVSSAVALAHARGRLPENLREEFDRLINAPKQSPENLKAVLNHILPWLQRAETMGQTPGGKGAGGGGDTATSPRRVIDLSH